MLLYFVAIISGWLYNKDKMARPISTTFNYNDEQLDINERYIRDIYNLDIENWAKFRYVINVGVDTANVIGTTDQDVLDSYLELGKGHYEVICSLGYSKYALDQYNAADFFAKLKSIKDFYFHAGSLLDNISRLIYIIKVPGAATKKRKKGDLQRHWIDRGTLLNDHASIIAAYKDDLDSDVIQQIVNVRNAITHYWKIPTMDDNWPLSELSTRQAFAWPYSEATFSSYSSWTPISYILQTHFAELIKAQSNIFGRLIIDITDYESNNKLQIR